MIHQLQMLDFKFDKLHIDVNKEFKREEDKIIGNIHHAAIKFSVVMNDHINKYNRKRLVLEMELNTEEEHFKKAPYKIILTAGLELATSPTISLEERYKLIHTSGLYLMITTLRAQLAVITRNFHHGEMLLPLFDLQEAQKGLKAVLDFHQSNDKARMEEEKKESEKLKKLQPKVEKKRKAISKPKK